MNTEAMNGSGLRPIYETPFDISAESAVADKLCCIWNVRTKKMKKFFPADVAALTNDWDEDSGASEVRAFIEIKVRKNVGWKYPTYMISLHKLYDLAALSSFSGIPSLLVVQWSDALGHWRVPESVDELEIRMGGTKSRGDEQDMEPVALIPIEQFSIINRDEFKGRSIT